MKTYPVLQIHVLILVVHNVLIGSMKLKKFILFSIEISLFCECTVKTIMDEVIDLDVLRGKSLCICNYSLINEEFIN